MPVERPRVIGAGTETIPQERGVVGVDPVIGEGIIDRLIHPSDRHVLKGGRYRERLSGPSLALRTLDLKIPGGQLR